MENQLGPFFEHIADFLDEDISLSTSIMLANFMDPTDLDNILKIYSIFTKNLLSNILYYLQ